MVFMLRSGAALLSFLLPCAALAQDGVSLHANYEAYAAGMQVAEVESSFVFGPRTYRMNLGYHTTGVVGVFLRGHQFDTVEGAWRGTQPSPLRFTGEGVWRGTDRLAEIEYQAGKPIVRKLVPPITDEREPVPDALQANTMDTLSALASLIRMVEATGRCEDTVRTYDGRRAVEIQAMTVGEEVLRPTGRSSFAGRALRCDFAGRLRAGFRFDDNRDRDSKPMHGSAWLAPLTVGGPPLPVRMTFETRWFGDATMYLTAVGSGSDTKVVARRD